MSPRDDTSGTARRHPWTIVAVVVVLVLASWPARFLHRGTAAPLDLYLYFYPIYDATYGRLAAGELPLWNPYQLCGLPWLATLQGGFFYPLHALYLMLPLPVVLAIGHGLHLLLVALATALFARRLGLGAAASVLASVLFTLRGFIPMSLGSTNYLDAASWMPVGALAVLELARRPGPGWVALLAAATALSFLGGYPQPTVYMLYTWATLLPVLLLREGADARRWGVTCALVGGAVALGVLAAAAQLVPTAELVRSGHHRELSPEAMSPFGNLSAAQLILANGAIAGSPFSYGITALALAAVALCTRRQRIIALWATGLCLVSVAFAFGPQSPLYDVYRRLPLLGMFRFPDRILSVTDFAFAIAAAVGLDAVIRPDATDGDRPTRTRIAALGAAVVVAVLVVLAWRGAAPPDRIVQVVAVAGLAGALLLTATAGTRTAVVGAALVALATADISLGPWAHIMSYGSRDIAAWDRYAPDYRAVGVLAGPDRVWFYDPVATLQPHFAQKLATRFRVHAIDDYEPLSPGVQAEYFTYFSEGASTFARPPWLFAGGIVGFSAPQGVPPPAARRRLLDLASLRFIVLPPTGPMAPDLQAFLTDAGFAPRPLDGSTLRLYENPHTLPRAFVTYRTLPAPDADTLLAALSQPSFDPLAASYVDGDAPLPFDPAAPAGRPARIVVDAERIVEVDAELERPGLVVLADAWYPGWRATVDGTPAPIVRTNHLFRGVAAPAGHHRIRFEYWPSSVAWGIAGSIVGWMAIATLALRGRRQRAR